MITNKELNVTSKDYIYKDFYQLYPEILDLVSKISERWHPSDSNESDPGVILLKLLAFMADKNNYNIDKAVLECFMPSASQESSMTKLCNLMGFDRFYYKSATTDISFMYQGTFFDDNPGKFIKLPMGSTVITNDDNSVNYVLIEDLYIDAKYSPKVGKAIEGTLCECAIGEDNVIRIQNLDDGNRYYLPESQIAENGVWIINASKGWEEIWTQTKNLNTQPVGTKCYRFCYDSTKGLPYIQFPADIASLIDEGLRIAYVRTSGSAGNVNAKALNQLASGVVLYDSTGEEIDSKSLEDEDKSSYLVISNLSATSNGEDPETIEESYNSFKKVVGTFDTLVTCRDYANAIYNMVSKEDNSTPLVGNSQVSDIRDDINSSASIITFNEYGKYWENIALEDESGKPKINHFDIVLHDFKPLVGSYNRSSYVDSFKPGHDNNSLIEAYLEDNKTLSHSIKYPKVDDIFCFKNYYDIKAKITTKAKVNTSEEKSILNNVYNALYKNFNSRKVDWGEEIPYDTILNVLENADERIKNVALDDPEINSKVLLGNGREFDLLEPDSVLSIRPYYLQYLAVNALSGAISILNYDNNFKYDYGETKVAGYDVVYPSDDTTKIKYLTTKTNITAPTNYILKQNEVVQFISPSLQTKVTYPMYVNYHWKGNTISANAEHKLTTDEYLYINYTDSNDVVHNVKYTIDHIITDGSSVEVPFNIIKPNFELKDSSTVAATRYWSKTTGFESTWGIAGMFALGSNEQIDLRDYVKSSLKTSLPCYWLTKDGTIPFNFTDAKTTGSDYILQEGEYFFYTNNAKTELVILGSGTKLTLHGTWTQDDFRIDYSSKQLDVDEVASKGLAAFADNPWKQMAFNPTTDYLDIQEMQFITLTEGDKILSIGVSPLDNDWKSITTAKYIIDGTEATLPIIVAGDQWKVRSRLDLDMGPTNKQILTSNQSIELKSSESGTIKTISGTSINCNYTLQKVGGVNLNAPSTVSIDNNTGELIQDYNSKFKVGTYTTPTYKSINSEGKEVEKTFSQPTDEGYTKLNLNSYKSASLNLPVLTPSSKYSILMIYYNTLFTDATKYIQVKEKNDKSILSFYNPIESGESNILKLTPGINVIKISGGQPCNLTLVKESGESGTVIIGSSRIIDSANKGLNMNFLSLNNDAERDELLKILRDYSTLDNKDIFYYNCPMENSYLIDTDKMSNPLTLFDYNDRANKFTICELDATKFDTNITLAKGSKL